jgi:Ohr subfamily peroxiredoxin
MTALVATTVQVTGGSGGTNPEQLLAPGLAACFASSVPFAARQRRTAHGPVGVTAEVVLTVAEDGRYGLKAGLDVDLPGVEPAERDAILAEPERICADSNATRGNVPLTFTA